MTTAQPALIDEHQHHSTPTLGSTEDLTACLVSQRQAFLDDGPTSLATRTDRIQRAIDLLVTNADAIADALTEDFSHRSVDQTRLADVAGSIEALKFARKNLKKWMRPERRRSQFPLGLLGATAEVRHQPLGVVGLISPWNFPVNLTFTPLAGVFAAGNRAMIKPSEFTPATAELMQTMFASAFDSNEVAVFPGGPEVGRAFSGLACDHLLFTGSTSVGHHVMRAAAENLVPCTLELGGKSPVLISESANLEEAATRIMNGKLLNAGQICLAPDYVLLPEGKLDAFVRFSCQAVEKMYPTLRDNPDYTSVVNQHHRQRLASYVAAARERGETVVEINPQGEDFGEGDTHKLPPTLILEPAEDSKVMTDEIFGPILPVLTTTDMDASIDFVNRRPRPLALYYFGSDQAEQARVLERTTSGGVTINDVVVHVSMEDLPFGGVGPSGMGAYHGYDGYKTFSHARSIFTQATTIDVGKLLRPPYGKGIRALLKHQISS